jgi:protein-tyrosine phosphatase
MVRWLSGGRWVAFGFVAVLVLSNLAIFVASRVMAVTTSAARPDAVIEGVSHLRVVDDQVWRGARPTQDGYRTLAANGVTTIVDLRAEDDVVEDQAYGRRLGVRVVSMPIRDGQLPSSDQIERFVNIVDESDGTVFVHCGAGVGRTGAMSAAYLVATGQAGGGEVLRRNLAVGPPSLEQLWFAATLDGDADRPPAPVVAVSRVLDAPRRILSSVL